jgi:ubiquinone/menaquinone biosynthesis C-methylase UbiE
VNTDPTAADIEQLLSEQVDYYRAMASEYDDHALREAGGDELAAAIESFRPEGSVLELACGQGKWTGMLLAHADSVTCLDASPEMLAIARREVDDPRASFVEADIFEWEPQRRYDAVFFAFWLSHVPLERFDTFWSLVDRCLEPDGRVFFVDDAYRTPEELIEGEQSSTIRRRLLDGTAFRAVKVPHTPAELQERLAEIGWRFSVHQTSGPFFWGAGGRGSRTEG